MGFSRPENEWVAFPLIRGSFQPRDQIQVSHIIHLPCRRPQFGSWVRKVLWRRDRLTTPIFLGFPCSSTGKESTCNMGDLGLIPGLGRSPGEGKGYPLQYSGLENSMYCIVHGVRKSWIWPSNSHFSLSKSLKTFKEHFSKYDSDNSYKFELERTLSRTNYFQDRNSSPAFLTDKIPNIVLCVCMKRNVGLQIGEHSIFFNISVYKFCFCQYNLLHNISNY